MMALPQLLDSSWIGAIAAARIRENRTITRALKIIEQRAVERDQLMSSPDACGNFFRLRLADELREHFEVAFLDVRHRLIQAERLFSGSVDQSTVHPRIVAQRALSLNAAAVLVAHNHPSGDPEPSHADRAVTKRLREALALVDVRLLDHFVVTNRAALSMATRGLI
ncbi:DNA repair protein RadC [Xanthomonas campestris pv. badrii]|uniref:DNA repair protein RadC n=1 Tax=Xanthomonas campestris pv. badrii TaxID=149696 RepID=A0A7Z2VCH6_XANCA|nr:DNA repair protein RadC [Xanthomonas campestris]QJD69054.1 DNA repair protein RadC [Xanthomonas campestris pv. badrii]